MKLVSIILSMALIAPAIAADKPARPASAPAAVKPNVKKPCKEGQDPEKNNCHVVKKAETKKK